MTPDVPSAPHAQPPAPEFTVEQSAAALIATLHRIAAQPGLSVLWPDGSETDTRRGEHARELVQHFQALRRRARDLCPREMLPLFEQELTEIEGVARAAVAGRLGPFWDLEGHVERVERFRDKWTAYFDPPPRVHLLEADRSVWLDGCVLGAELTREGFAFVRVLTDLHPDTVPWSRVQTLARECRGKNATRVKNTLPRPVRRLIEGTPSGYALQLA